MVVMDETQSEIKEVQLDVSESLSHPHALDSGYSEDDEERDDFSSGGYFSCEEEPSEANEATALPKAIDITEPGMNIFSTSGRKIHREQGSNSYRSRIESELFSGEQLLIFREEEPERNGKYHAGCWEGKKRRYVYQLQGRFRRKPTGPIVFQVELSCPTPP